MMKRLQVKKLRLIIQRGWLPIAGFVLLGLVIVALLWTNNTKEREISTTQQLPVISTTPSGKGRAIAVATSAQLHEALTGAIAGDVITLADGMYAGKFTSGKYTGSFGSAASGIETEPITVIGSRNAVIEGGGNYGLYLVDANYWTISGITVRNATKGIVLDRSNHILLRDILVSDIEQEGIHFRSFSSDNIITHSTITKTGLKSPQYGEGVYIGSARSNWKTYSEDRPDASDRNTITHTTISQTGAESIDIKEGSSGGSITHNSFDGTGMSGENYADSWVDVKGNDYTIDDNTGINSINDGFQVHSITKEWGHRNSFSRNRANVNGPGYGFLIQSSAKDTKVHCNNIVTNAAAGMSNLTCTQ